MLSRYFIYLILAMMTVSCCPCTQAYKEQYAYLKKPCRLATPMAESDFFLVLLVDARHLDYSDNRSLMRTLVKHPSDGSKNSDVGHAWIYLRGISDGVPIEIEGGHSGERGLHQAKYFEGVMNNIAYGCPNPTAEDKLHPTYEPNPIKYLWDVQRDGFFQEGCGRHRPTFAAKVDITEEQFWEIIAFMDPGSYRYSRYAITVDQCCSFVSRIAALAGLEVDCDITISIDQQVSLGGVRYTLWEDPHYATLTFSSPDVVERSLVYAVREGRAQSALAWYLSTHKRPRHERLQECWETLIRFPERILRVICL